MCQYDRSRYVTRRCPSACLLTLDRRRGCHRRYLKQERSRRVLRCLQPGSSGELQPAIKPFPSSDHPQLAPVIGPVLGGALADGLGWRSIFWFLCIFSGCCLLFVLVCVCFRQRHYSWLTLSPAASCQKRTMPSHLARTEYPNSYTPPSSASSAARSTKPRKQA